MSAPEAWVRRVLPGVLLEERTAPFAEARTWACRVDGRVVAWLKVHVDAGRAAREEAACRRWGGALGGPRPLARDGAAVLLAHVPGRPAATLDAPGQRRALTAVGSALARLHALPHVDDDPMPLDVALRRRAAGWLARAHAAPAALVARVTARWRALPPVRGGRVPCHRDVQLHNVLVDGDRVALIDLGQARPDLGLVDLVKLLAEPWRLPPGGPAALREGYGAALHDDEERWLDALIALHGVATWSWCARHGDDEGVARAEAILAWWG